MAGVMKKPQNLFWSEGNEISPSVCKSRPIQCPVKLHKARKTAPNGPELGYRCQVSGLTSRKVAMKQNRRSNGEAGDVRGLLHFSDTYVYCLTRQLLIRQALGLEG